MKRTLITGAAGFIGSHLCEYLLSRGHMVTAVDNLITGSIDNFDSFGGVDAYNFRFIDCPVQNFKIDDVYDYIYHLASIASPVYYKRYPVATLLASSEGSLHMLKVAKGLRARILLASTSEVYGDPLQHPQQESYFGNVNPFGERACYDEAKRFQEAAGYVYQQQGVDVRIARIFNTYGPRMRSYDGRVVPTFINQALRNECITLHGAGEQTRSLCYISDMVQGLVTLMESDYTKPVNLGNPEEISMIDLAQEIKQLCGSHSEIISMAATADDPVKRCPDITLAKKQLSWAPMVTRTVGLVKTISYYKTIMQ